MVGETEIVGEENRGVSVTPRQQRNDADRVGSRNVAEAGIGGRGASSVGHERNGVARVVEAGGPLNNLTGTNQYGSARVESHTRGSVRPGQCPGTFLT